MLLANLAQYPLARARAGGAWAALWDKVLALLQGMPTVVIIGSTFVAKFCEKTLEEDRAGYYEVLIRLMETVRI